MIKNTRENTATPLALLVGCAWAEDGPEARALAAAGWLVRIADRGDAALELLAGGAMPTLIMADIRLPDMPAARLVAAIRDAGRAMPVVARGIVDPAKRRTLFSQGFDGIVPRPCTAEALVREAETWRPDGSAAALARLEDTFGVEPIRSLATRFATLLEEAMAALGSDEAESIAHRVAGIAGTLGFGAAGRAWLAIAEDGGSARAELLEEEARRQSRRAVGLIARP